MLLLPLVAAALAEKSVPMKAASNSHFPYKCNTELHLGRAAASTGFSGQPEIGKPWLIIFATKERLFVYL